MKKLASSLIIALLLCQNAYAGIISVPAFSADSSVAHLETFRTTVSNAINGQIQGSGTTGSSTNVLASSLGELDMAAEINPRVRANELLGIGTDTTTIQNTFVYTGLTPATAAGLTSNISAGTAYVNGYRVNKSATSETYTASQDTYVDLNQSGAFTLSPVNNGSAAPAVATNSARLAKVVTNGTQITTVTDLANRRLPGLVVTTNYRVGFTCAQATTNTITVDPGVIEENNLMVSKTAQTTLTLTTAGDWAGGVSLNAASQVGYIGIDASGNIKMHTTAPQFSNYGLNNTAGVLRYVSWSSTTYRVIGWFRTNPASQVTASQVSSFAEMGIVNSVISSDTTARSGSTAFAVGTAAPNNSQGDQYFWVPFVPSNSNDIVTVDFQCSGSSSAASRQTAALYQDSGSAISVAFMSPVANNQSNQLKIFYSTRIGSTAPTIFKVRIGDTSGVYQFNSEDGINQKQGGLDTWIKITETPS